MIKEAKIFFGGTEHYDLKITEDDAITLDATKDGVTTEYDVTGGGGGGIERKPLYTNPDTSQQMSGDTLFEEAEIEGYQYLCFTVTDTSGSYEVEEWCEIAPLKTHGGQFIVSMIISGTLYGRKIYRSSGNVKASTAVYELGKTTENRDACIIKTVEAVKGV